MNDPMNEQELETRLARLKLAKPSGDFLAKGQQLIMAQQPETFWHRHLMLVLGSALTLSIAVNVVQLVAAFDRPDSLNEMNQVAQCNTPVVSLPHSARPAFNQTLEFKFADNTEKPQPLGLC